MPSPLVTLPQERAHSVHRRIYTRDTDEGLVEVVEEAELNGEELDDGPEHLASPPPGRAPPAAPTPKITEPATASARSTAEDDVRPSFLFLYPDSSSSFPPHPLQLSPMRRRSRVVSAARATALSGSSARGVPGLQYAPSAPNPPTQRLTEEDTVSPRARRNAKDLLKSCPPSLSLLFLFLLFLSLLLSPLLFLSSFSPSLPLQTP